MGRQGGGEFRQGGGEGHDSSSCPGDPRSRSAGAGCLFSAAGRHCPPLQPWPTEKNGRHTMKSLRRKAKRKYLKSMTATAVTASVRQGKLAEMPCAQQAAAEKEPEDVVGYDKYLTSDTYRTLHQVTALQPASGTTIVFLDPQFPNYVWSHSSLVFLAPQTWYHSQSHTQSNQSL